MSNRHCSLAYTAAVDALSTQVRVMLKQARPLESEDADAVHDMRVASRRLRAIMAEQGDLFDRGAVNVAREHVREVTQTLSKARELDVSCGILDELRKRMHGPGRLAANHALRVVRLLRSTESEPVVAMARRVGAPPFGDMLQRVSGSFGRRRACLLKRAIRNTTRRYEAVVAAYRAWESDCRNGGAGTEALHALRIAFKKLRYTCEIYRDVYGEAMAELIAQLKDVQDKLGDWHDYAVLRALVERTRASAPPKAGEGMPVLCESLDARVAELLGDFRQHAETFFDPDRQERVRVLLSSIEHTCCWSEPAMAS